MLLPILTLPPHTLPTLPVGLYYQRFKDVVLVCTLDPGAAVAPNGINFTFDSDVYQGIEQGSFVFSGIFLLTRVFLFKRVFGLVCGGCVYCML